MNPRIIALAALAAVSILTTPAEARRQPAQAGAPIAEPAGNNGHWTAAAAPAQAHRARHIARRAPAKAVKLASLDPTITGRQIAQPAPSQEPAAGTLRAGERYNPRTGMLTVRTAYGFPITVHPAYAAKYLKLFALMKARHYVIPPKLTNAYYAGLGGYASHGHVPGSNHYIGGALDLQWGFGAGPAFVYTKEFAGMIRAAGLFNGGRFGDWGHVEAQTGTHNRAPNSKLALEHFLQERLAAENDEALAWAEPTSIVPVVEVSAHQARHHRRHHHHRRLASNQSG